MTSRFLGSPRSCRPAGAVAGFQASEGRCLATTQQNPCSHCQHKFSFCMWLPVGVVLSSWTVSSECFARRLGFLFSHCLSPESGLGVFVCWWWNVWRSWSCVTCWPSQCTDCPPGPGYLQVRDRSGRVLKARTILLWPQTSQLKCRPLNHHHNSTAPQTHTKT